MINGGFKSQLDELQSDNWILKILLLHYHRAKTH